MTSRKQTRIEPPPPPPLTVACRFRSNGFSSESSVVKLSPPLKLPNAWASKRNVNDVCPPSAFTVEANGEMSETPEGSDIWLRCRALPPRFTTVSVLLIG